MHATHEKALDSVSLEDLRAHAAEPEVGNASNVAQGRNGNGNGIGSVPIKERTELASKDDMTSRVDPDNK